MEYQTTVGRRLMLVSHPSKLNAADAAIVLIEIVYEYSIRNRKLCCFTIEVPCMLTNFRQFHTK
jgi:hypothetical protein